MYLGSQRSAFAVTLDTGSNMLVIQDTSCTACQATFNKAQSSTFETSTVRDSIFYGDGSYVYGYKVHDTLALDSTGSQAVTSFNFLLGYDEYGFEDMDGLIGLSRTTDRTYDMIYDQLFKQGVTSSKVFSFYMAEDSYQSSIEFGGLDTTNLKNSAQFVYLPLTGSNLFYNVPVRAFQIGTGASKKAYATRPGTRDSCLDTGTTLMYVPKAYFSTIIGAIIAGTSAT